jgi:hypothetical protein
MAKYHQCYNCSNEGSTREHVIPKFLLRHSEEGLTVPCCNTCRVGLKWLDDYGSDYFMFHRSHTDISEWEKWFKQQLIKNGSPLSLRTFGEYTVIDENLLMFFIQKVCIGVASYLFGRLDDSYRLYVFTNFSKLGGYCQYNNPNDMSLTQEQTEQFEMLREQAYQFFKNIVDTYGIIAYKVANARISYTAKHIVQGARWFHISIYNRYNIVCAVTDCESPGIDQARNMLITSFPVKIDLDELAKLNEKVKLTEHGDKPAYILAGSPISEESKILRRSSLKELGVSNDEIEAFEASLLDRISNKGGREELAEKFRGYYIRKRK